MFNLFRRNKQVANVTAPTGRVVGRFRALVNFEATVNGRLSAYFKGGVYNIREGNYPLQHAAVKWLAESKIVVVDGKVEPS